MLKVGFIGAGGRAQDAHYPTVYRMDGVSVQAVCELDTDKLQKVSNKYNIPRTFSDHRTMLEQVDLDVVYCIMHENWLLQPVLDCLNAGKHVMTEKPPGRNSNETEKMLEAAISNDVYCMTAFQRRFSAVTQEAVRLASEHSEPTHVIGTFNKCMVDYPKSSLEGGHGQTTLWDDVCHVVDLVRFLAGLSEVVEVTSYQDVHGSANRLNKGGGRNCYTSMIRFANKCVGTVFGNRSSGGRVLRSELHAVGLGCYMQIPEQIDIYRDNNPMQTIRGYELTNSSINDQPAYEGILALHQHFIDCIKNGQVPSSDLRDVIKTVKLVDQLEGVS